MSTFLIVGGTGKVGSRLAQILQQKGHVALAASRTGGDVRFDWRDESTYREALDGVDGVFIVGPGSATDWSGILSRFLTTAAEVGVGHAVFLSARGVEFLPDGAVARAEAALVAGPIPWTILRPTHFAQNFTEAMFVPVDDTVTAPVALGSEPFIDVEDIAEVAAVILADNGWINEVIELSGPRAITFAEAVDVLADHTGLPLRYESEEPQLHRDRLQSAGTPEGYIEWRMAMLGGIRRGEDAYLSYGVEQVLGRPAVSFSTWASREASALVVQRKVQNV